MKCFFYIFLMLSLLSWHLKGQVYYVATNGNDSNPGTRENPFLSLGTAVEKAKGKSDAAINIREGTYHFSEPVLIGPEHSGLTITAFEGEDVKLSGGMPLRDWKKVSHPRPGNGRPKKVWMTKLDAHSRFLTLFDTEGMLPRCASAKYKAKEAKEEDGEEETIGNDNTFKASRTQLLYRPRQIDHVRNFKGAELFLLPRYDWVANYLPIKAVDRDMRAIETVCPGTYELTTPPTWTGMELFYRVENVPEFLDEPGEWFLDIEKNELYLIPRNGVRPEGVIAPVLNQLVHIQGNADTNNRLVADVTINGITFMHTERMSWANGRVGIQHDWGIVDGKWAAIKARGTRNIEIKNCLFEHSGGDGIRLDLEGWGSHIHHNEFRHLGGTAVSLIGRAPGTRDELHSNVIANNHIHHCANLWWLQSGIMVCQSSNNTVANNLIHDMPYNGISLVGGRSGIFGQRDLGFEGNGKSYVNTDEIPEAIDQWYEKIGFVNTRDNFVQNNEIYHVVTMLGDGNGIYVSGTGPGNVLQKNYVHDITSISSAGGLRFDNDTWFCTMRNNVVWNVNGSNIVSKHVNTVENNIMVNSGVRSVLSIAAGPKWGSHIRRNILVNRRDIFEPTMNQWMGLEDIMVKGTLEECTITNNVFYLPDDEVLGQNVVKKLNANFGTYRNILADPLFFNLEQGDFRLKAKSPALQSGFIPFTDYGVQGLTGPQKK